MDKNKIIIAIVVILLVLAMVLPVFASVFAAGEETIEREEESQFVIPIYVYIIIGIVFLIVAFILKKKDDKKEKDPMEDIKLLKYYEDTKKDSWNNKK